jgi:hypothetical protein
VGQRRRRVTHHRSRQLKRRERLSSRPGGLNSSGADNAAIRDRAIRDRATPDDPFRDSGLQPTLMWP